MAKEHPVHCSGHQVPQPAYHNGVNPLSSSQVSCHTSALLAENKGSNCLTVLSDHHKLHQL